MEALSKGEMQGRVAWWWILVLALLLLAPGPAGRLVLDVVGGVTLLLIVLPLVLGGAGWLGWLLLQRRLRTCEACGFRSLGNGACPACGTPFGGDPSAEAAFDARDVTIDVKATDVENNR